MKKLVGDQCGAVAPFLAATIFLLIGIGALVVELPRMATFTTDLQNAADAAALAGAAELTGVAGATNRATNAAISAFSNAQLFGSGSTTITLTSANIQFLSALPSSDSTPIPNSDIIASNAGNIDSQARFIYVTIPNQGINFAFSSIFGVTNTTATVTAVAGNNEEVCQTPPMFICNPTEPTGNTNTALPVNYNPADPSPYTLSVAGVSIRGFYAGGSSAQYSPGNFGLLCPAGGKNCNPTSQQMAKLFAAPQGSCIRTQNSQILSKPGVDQNSVAEGLNIRFDDWDNYAAHNWQGVAGFTPAYNVTQGRSVPKSDTNGNKACPSGGGSNAFPMPTSGTSDALMPDSCLLSNTCTNGNIGDGTWGRSTYFNVNHDSTSVPAALGTNPSPYQVYRWEVQNASTTAPTNPVTPNEAISGSTTLKTTENGQSNTIASPTTGYACSSGQSPDSYSYNYANVPGDGKSTGPNGTTEGSLTFGALVDRRLMPVAIEDCIAQNLAGGSQIVTPVEWDYAFVIGPMSDPFYSQTYNNNNSAIFFQLLGPMSQTDLSQAVHNVVRLYRY